MKKHKPENIPDNPFLQKIPEPEPVYMDKVYYVNNLARDEAIKARILFSMNNREE